MRSTGSHAPSRRTCCGTSRWQWWVRAPAPSARSGHKPSCGRCWRRSAPGYWISSSQFHMPTPASTKATWPTRRSGPALPAPWRHWPRKFDDADARRSSPDADRCLRTGDHLASPRALEPLHVVPLELAVAHYDEPPPEVAPDLDELRRRDALREANELCAWIEIDCGEIVDYGQTGRSLVGEGLIAIGKGGAKRIRVGIIGANPDRGWAAQAHIPALTSLSDDFEITALSTSRRESADAASKRFGVPAAFDNHQELVNSPDVDVVAVTVKVPHHLELASAALDAGKAVYCEWPLGNGLKEAETLAALAKKKGVLAVAGLQARAAPPVAYVRDLIQQGYVGEVLSTTLIGSGMGWGPTVEAYNAYLNDKSNGATMLSIALGHATDALCHCLGEVRELSATMTSRRTTATIAGTGESQPMTAEDQVCVTGLLEGGAALAIHYRGGSSRGTNLLWEINGTEGDLQLTAAGGQVQIFELEVRGGRGAQSSLEILPVPEQYRWAPPQRPGPSTNVAQAYARFARDYREGTHLCPTFEDALTRHRMLDAIETAAATGHRQTLG